MRQEARQFAGHQREVGVELLVGVLGTFLGRFLEQVEEGEALVSVVCDTTDGADRTRDALARATVIKFFGAEVIAKIDCGRRSLGYVLFGDVIEFIRKRFWL